MISYLLFFRSQSGDEWADSHGFGFPVFPSSRFNKETKKKLYKKLGNHPIQTQLDKAGQKVLVRFQISQSYPATKQTGSMLQGGRCQVMPSEPFLSLIIAQISQHNSSMLDCRFSLEPTSLTLQNKDYFPEINHLLSRVKIHPSVLTGKTFITQRYEKMQLKFHLYLPAKNNCID